jgi:hypothetical protein
MSDAARDRDVRSVEYAGQYAGQYAVRSTRTLVKHESAIRAAYASDKHGGFTMQLTSQVGEYVSSYLGIDSCQ